MTTGTRPTKFDLSGNMGMGSWQTVLDICQTVERLGFNAFFTGDHLMPVAGWDRYDGFMEGWTLVAALAPVTQRIRLGVLVSGITYRHPVMLAKIAATVDVVSNGRLEFGVGAGWSAEDHLAYGFPFPPFRERAERLEEALQLIRLLWSERSASFQGKHYTLANAPFEPKPVQKPHPPIMIAGASDRTLRVLARYGDVWNATGTVAFLQEKMRTLDRYCAEVGRDPAEIERSIYIELALTDDAKLGEAIVRKRAATLAPGRRVRLAQSESALESESPEERARGTMLVGTSEQVRQQVQRLVDAGVTRIIIRTPRPFNVATMERFSREVMAAFR